MSAIAPLIALGAFAIYCLYGCVLTYHWLRYGASVRIILLSLGTYIVSGIYLFLTMLAASFI